MDVEFQRTYGIELYRAKGTADHWTALEQMWVAERAYQNTRILAVAEHGAVSAACYDGHRGLV